MLVRILTQREPFYDGKPLKMGTVIDLPASDAKYLIEIGFASAERKKSEKAEEESSNDN